MKNVILSLILILFPIFLFAQDELPQGTELLVNNYFDDGLANWEFFSLENSRAEYELDTNSVITGKNCVHIKVYKPYGGYPSGRIQLNQHNIPGGITEGNTYYISFNFKANKDLDNGFWTIYKEPDYHEFYNWDWVKCNKNTINNFSYTFQAEATDQSVYFAIDFASFQKDSVELWIDDIHFIAVGEEQEEYPDKGTEKDLPDGTEKLTNKYFDDGLDNWEFFSLDNSRAEYELDSDSVITGKNCVHVIVHNPYKNNPSGRIQLNQHNIPGGIVEGKYYFVSFNLKANKDIEKCFWNIYDEPDYTKYYNFDWVKAKANEVTHLSYRFQAKETDNSVYFAIDFGALRNDNTEIWLDDFHLIAVPDPLVENPLPRGALELLNNNYFDDGLNNWTTIANEDTASISLSTNYILEGKNSVHIKVNKAFANNPQKMRLYQENLLDSVKAGSKYYVQFMAKSSKAISGLFWSVNQQNTPNEILYSKEVSLPADEIVFVTDTITAFSSNEKVSWSLDLGTISQDSVDIWVDGIHFMELVKVPKAIFPPETTWETRIPETLPKPGYLQSVRDPQYGVDYTCIADPSVFNVPSGSGALRTHYSKDQAWNADMSKIILGDNYLLNADDYTLDKVLSFSGGDSRWSNTDPNKRYYCSGEGFYYINIITNQTTLLHRFKGYTATIGPWEGNISADDKYVVITDERGGTAHRASLYDIELDSVISTKLFPDDENIDWVSISSGGNFIVLNEVTNYETRVYDLNFNYLRTVGVSSEHGDLTFDSEGNEVWVQVIPVSMSRLSDGKFTRLLEASGFGGHISGRGFNNPGWALVSTGIYSGASNTEIFEVKLDGSGIIRHFGYARSSCTTYDNYPKGTVSPDGKKVIFNSDWLYGTGTGGDAVAFVSEYLERGITGVGENGRDNISIRDFTLSQNYPNPFNPTTTINFTINIAGMVKLSIYNVLGQEVKVLLDENILAGSYSVPFNGSNLTSGIYFYKLQSNNQMEVKKMLLVK